MTTATVAAHPMNLWRLEWLRLVRTPRAVSLAAVYVATGLIEPVATKYASALLAHVAPGTVVSLPEPTAAQALSSYVSEATVIGLIVLVAVAASTYNFDARPGLSAFFRTRALSMWQLVAPRFAASAAAGVLAYLLGTLAAWYETQLLIGSLPAVGLLAGMLCAAVYLLFAVAVTAFATSLTKNTVASVGITLAILLAALPLLGDVHAISSWVPTALVGAPAALVTSPPADDLAHFAPALGVSAVAGALALAAAVLRLQAREI